MVDGLPAIRAGVDDGAKAVGQAFFGRELCCDGEHVAEEGNMFARGVGQRVKMLTRNDEEVSRSLWRDVAKGDDVLILMEFCDRNLIPGDLAEDAIHRKQNSPVARDLMLESGRTSSGRQKIWNSSTS